MTQWSSRQSTDVSQGQGFVGHLDVQTIGFLPQTRGPSREMPLPAGRSPSPSPASSAPPACRPSAPRPTASARRSPPIGCCSRSRSCAIFRARAVRTAIVRTASMMVHDNHDACKLRINRSKGVLNLQCTAKIARRSGTIPHQVETGMGAHSGSSSMHLEKCTMAWLKSLAPNARLPSSFSSTARACATCVQRIRQSGLSPLREQLRSKSTRRGIDWLAMGHHMSGQTLLAFFISSGCSAASSGLSEIACASAPCVSRT